MKKILGSAIAAVLSISLIYSGMTISAEDTENDKNTFTDEILTYEKVGEGNVAIVDCNGSAVSVTIGEEIDGYKIIGISENAFSENTGIREIKIADGIKNIGNGAFSGCTSLERVKLPAGIEEIPSQAFAFCSSLKEVEIPESVTVIREYAFAYCDDLTWLEIPGNVKTICDYAFSCSKLNGKLVIPEGVEEIMSCAFLQCQGIETVDIPSTLNTLGTLTFSSCEEMKSYNVSEKNSIYTSADGVLYSDGGKTLESYPSGKEETTFNIPDSVTALADGAFFGNKYLTEVTLTENIKTIGSGVFSYCSALERAEISEGISEITDSMFSDCMSLWRVNIPNSVTSIGAYAFLKCDKLSSIDIPDSVTEIGEYALGFYDDEEQNLKVYDDFVINANFETAARDYAKKNNVDINYLDGNKDMIKILLIVGAVVVILGIGAFIIVKTVLKKKKSQN